MQPTLNFANASKVEGGLHRTGLFFWGNAPGGIFIPCGESASSYAAQFFHTLLFLSSRL